MNKLTKQIEKILDKYAVKSARYASGLGIDIIDSPTQPDNRPTKQILSTIKEYIAKDIIGEDTDEVTKEVDKILQRNDLFNSYNDSEVGSFSEAEKILVNFDNLRKQQLTKLDKDFKE